MQQPYTTLGPGKQATIFVYGTLKYGFPNWHAMPAAAQYLGTARTTVPYPLVVDDRMGCPYVLDLPHHPSAQPVHGELYTVTPDVVAFLDDFEGLASGFYVRKEIDLLVTSEPGDRQREADATSGKVLESGSVIQASGYFRGPAGPEWAKDLTVAYLQTFPMYDRYTAELTSAYITRDQR
eukprot:GFKZ01009303.1.p1 GENE.GFKZ01009303.1~~GFKZ01009303.1.p1  ORF type:complete len:180 (-),score=4.99 GFKZ01009303.1:401-940(-)